MTITEAIRELTKRERIRFTICHLGRQLVNIATVRVQQSEVVVDSVPLSLQMSGNAH